MDKRIIQTFIIASAFLASLVYGLEYIKENNVQKQEKAKTERIETIMSKPVIKLYEFRTPEGLVCVSTAPPKGADAMKFGHGISCNWEKYNYEKNNNLL